MDEFPNFEFTFDMDFYRYMIDDNDMDGYDNLRGYDDLNLYSSDDDSTASSTSDGSQVTVINSGVEPTERSGESVTADATSQPNIASTAGQQEIEIDKESPVPPIGATTPPQDPADPPSPLIQPQIAAQLQIPQEEKEFLPPPRQDIPTPFSNPSFLNSDAKRKHSISKTGSKHASDKFLKAAGNPHQTRSTSRISSK